MRITIDKFARCYTRVIFENIILRIYIYIFFTLLGHHFEECSEQNILENMSVDLTK